MRYVIIEKRNSRDILSNIHVSPKVARLLRQKKMRCLVPVSATDLVWQEAIGMFDADQGDDNNADMVTR